MTKPQRQAAVRRSTSEGCRLSKRTERQLSDVLESLPAGPGVTVNVIIIGEQVALYGGQITNAE